MKITYKHLIIAILTVALIVPSPILALAKDNGNGNGKGNGKSEKSQKIEKAEKKEQKKIAQAEKKEDRDRNDNENDDDKEDREEKVKKNQISWVGCVTKSFGHLIAPGWIKKNGQITLSEDCTRDGLPNGIAWLYGYHSTSTPTTTPDTVAPVLSNFRVRAVSTSTAIVSWDTNEKSDSTVWYSTNSPVNTATASSSNKNELTKNHNIHLNNLSANTTYYVIVKSKDNAGNTSTSTQISFKTLALGTNVDTSAPVIINAVATSTTHNTAKITWTTDELADTKIWYSTSSPVTIGSSTFAMVSGFDLDHTVNLSGLNASTTYYAIIVAKDILGNTGTSSQLTFTTLETPTTTPVAPVISNIVATVGTSTVKITWDTDVASNSTVFYGTSSPLDITSSTTASSTSSTLVTNHEINVSGLATSTTYYFVVQSKNAVGTIKNSNQFSLTTSF